MANNINNDAQLQRMKALMNYGINESKQPEYSTVEYSKVAADGKLYGIVREGTQFYVKVAKNAKGNLVNENFDYIGGFRNRKDNCFESFASAHRFFDEKMLNINESLDRIQKTVIEENYINEKKDVIAEQTDKMQREIARQRQIMENAQNIMEKKEQCCCEPVKGKDAEKNSKSPKCDAKNCESAVDYHGKPIKKTASAPFNEPVNLKESTETPLSSRENPEYMDKSHGTKIGNNAPFCEPKDKVENAVADENGGEAETSHLTEGESMHDTDNQNSPTPGVGEKGDNAPFEKKVNESLCELDDELDDDTEADFDVEGEDDFDVENEEMPMEDGVEDDIEASVDDIEGEDAGIEAEIGEEGDIESRLSGLEAKMDAILNALNDMKYDDDEELYDDEEDSEDEDESEYDLEMGDDEEMPMEDEEEPVVKESRSFKAMKARLVNEENRLDDFGKHPAYQKKVMSLPANNNFKRNGQYDINDDSVDGEKPYGVQKGNNAPFNVSREQVENEITESVLRIIKKKVGLNERHVLELPKQAPEMSEPPMPEGLMPPMGDAPEPPTPNDEPPMDDMPMDGPEGKENGEINDIFDKLDTEKQAAVIKYAKSMVNDEDEPSDEPPMDDMPMEGRKRLGAMVNEIINNILNDSEEGDIDDREDNKVRNKKITKDNPYISKR